MLFDLDRSRVLILFVLRSIEVVDSDIVTKRCVDVLQTSITRLREEEVDDRNVDRCGYRQD